MGRARSSQVSDETRAAVLAAAVQFAEARANRARAVEAAKEVARELYAAGLSEVELAKGLGVDRARTLRRWLNKMPSSQSPRRTRNDPALAYHDGLHAHSLFCEDSRDNPNVLYRMFDADNNLLYVGITFNPQSRFTSHRRDKDWWRDIARISLSHYECRVDLAEAERQAILEERPLYNVSLNAVDSGLTNSDSDV
jgi:hypothetical protein